MHVKHILKVVLLCELLTPPEIPGDYLVSKDVMSEELRLRDYSGMAPETVGPKIKISPYRPDTERFHSKTKSALVRLTCRGHRSRSWGRGGYGRKERSRAVLAEALCIHSSDCRSY